MSSIDLTPRDYFEQVVLTWNSNDCLLWPYARISTGYGQLAIEPGQKGKRVLAHREACRRVHGEPPAEHYDCAHSCNNGHLGCVNPKHMRWATRQENVMDAHKAGTRGRGTGANASKLTKESVAEIRDRIAAGERNYLLALEFGVSQAAISQIRHGKRW